MRRKAVARSASEPPLLRFLLPLVLCALATLLAGPRAATAVVAEGETAPSTGTDAIPIGRGRDTISLSAASALAEELRHLDFLKPISPTLLDLKSVREFLDRRIEEELPEKDFANMVRAYQRLGLLGDKVEGLRAVVLEMYTEQVVAFYDHRAHRLYVRTGLPFSAAFHEGILVHELTHALQDQHFDLSKLPLDEKRNDDRAIAALSLIEGDATLVFSQYFLKGGKFGLRDLLASMTQGAGALRQAPYALQQNLVFPYSAGTAFITELYTQGGWEAIDAAYGKVPASSEQILHPERYIEEFDEPQDVALPDLRPLLGRGWSLLEDNVLGELNTRLLLGEFIGRWRAKQPAAGWDGDRFRVYESKDRDRWVLVWKTLWDSEQEAAEFFEAYARVVPKKYSDAVLVGEAQGARVWQHAGGWVLLVCREAAAFTVEAPTEALLDRIVDEKGLAGMTVFPLPPAERER